MVHKQKMAEIYFDRQITYIQNFINVTSMYLHRLLVDSLQLGKMHVNRRRRR
jgi:hypothetical protein